MTIDKEIINQMKNVAEASINLSDIIDVNRYNDILHLNLPKLDVRSGEYYLGEKELSLNVLNKVTLYFGIDKAKPMIGEYLSSIGTDASLIDNVDAFTIGNDIFVMYEKPITFDDADIRLFAHETIHSLQQEAITTFLEEYFSLPYSTENEFEVAAYKFGGNEKCIGMDLGNNQVFKEFKLS